MESVGLKGIKLVASDLDGTLLQNGAKTPTPEAFELIHELHRHGVVFMPASGRPYMSLRHLFAPIADELAYLCENGGMVMQDDAAVVKRAMPRALAEEIWETVDARPEAFVFASGERCAYVLRGHGNEEFAERVSAGNHAPFKVVDRPGDVEEDIVKLAYQTSHEEQPRVRGELEALFGERVELVTSGWTWTDFIIPGADKGPALVEYGRILGIDPSEMLAFGDNENDRGMLDAVGHPYLMESCNPVMRGLNDRVRYVGTVEEGLRRLLDREH